MEIEGGSLMKKGHTSDVKDKGEDVTRESNKIIEKSSQCKVTTDAVCYVVMDSVLKNIKD